NRRLACPHRHPLPRVHALQAFFQAVVRGGDAEADVALAVLAVAAAGGDHHPAVVEHTGGVIGAAHASWQLRPDVEARLRRVNFEPDLAQGGDHAVAAALVDGV